MTETATETKAKLELLRAALRKIGSAAVAFSAGVDSTFLLRVAHEELGERVIVVTVRSPLIPRHELDEAEEFCRREGIRHEFIDFDALAVPVVVANPPDRCYHCKKEIFGRILEFAHAHGLAAVLEGSNLDDDGVFAPGGEPSRNRASAARFTTLALRRPRYARSRRRGACRRPRSRRSPVSHRVFPTVSA